MISVIIPNLHSPLIDQVVAALRQQTASDALHEILVVGQDTHNLVPPGVQHIVTRTPLAAASARNLGARLASGTYLLFLDADCLAAPDLFEHLLARHQQGYAVVGGSIVLDEHERYWALSDNMLSFAPFLATAAPGPRRYLPSLNLSIARDVLYAVQGFDQRFPGAAGEDMDLSLRLRQRGYELWFEPRAMVRHCHQRASARDMWEHLRSFGRVHVALQRRYGKEAAARLDARMRPLSGAILAGSPLLALWDVLRLYQHTPALWRYAHALPGMVWGKMAWYWGVVEAMHALPPSEAPTSSPAPIQGEKLPAPPRPSWERGPGVEGTRSTPRPAPRLLVIGLDCAAPELIFDAWRSDLPTLNRLMSQGVYARMESCIPAITVPAWSCMMSSQDPGQLGIYGFRNRADHTYQSMSIATSQAVKVPRLWDILGAAGKRVGVVGVPQTYPVAPLNGDLVSCFLTPNARSGFTYPPGLKEEVTGWFYDEFLMDVPNFRSEDKARILQDIYRMAEQHFETCKRLLSRQHYDFFMTVDMGVDRIHHALWKPMDPNHPRHTPGHPFASAIHNYYQFIDHQIADLLSLVDDNTIVVVVSDHGAKPMVGGICLNEWLIQQGYLVLHDYPSTPVPLEKCQVDWARTRAWGAGGYYGRLFLNVQGREPQGCVAPDAYETLRDELVAQLEGLPDHTGQQSGTRVFKPEAIYRQVQGIAPDLLVYFGDLDWRSVGQVGIGQIYTFENDTGPDEANHAQHGMVILYDPRRSGPGQQVDDISIYDIAPTLLHLLEQPIPEHMRGTARVFW
jgi:predicted AlkP superfamily phosphohydrolase/phosphomutase/GT2 family glycosyltransferase